MHVSVLTIFSRNGRSYATMLRPSITYVFAAKRCVVTGRPAKMNTIRYDTIGEFNVDWKAEYSALSSTRSQKKKLKQPTPVPL